MSARHPTASVVVIDPDANAVLLVWHRASRLWVFPGGHVDEGETPAEAAVREVREETGLDVTLAVPFSFAIQDFDAPAKPARPGKPAEDPHVHVDWLFAATADSSLPTTAALSEVAEVRWQPLDCLGELDVRAEVPTRCATAARLLGSLKGAS